MKKILIIGLLSLLFGCGGGGGSSNNTQPNTPTAEEIETARLAIIEAARIETARLAAIETARLEAERLEAERLEAERLEAERLEAERLEAERLARLEAERLEAERLEAERLEAERLEAERLEAERLEAERLEAERLEAERLEAERLEAERLEAERLEAERLEAERLEAERLEAERLEAERLEAERLEAERLEAERLEAERLEAERLAAIEAQRFAEAQANKVGRVFFAPEPASTPTTIAKPPPPDSGRIFTTTPAVVANIGDTLIPNAGTGEQDSFFMAGGYFEQSGGSNVVDIDRFVLTDGFNIFGKKIRGNPAGNGSLTVFNPPRDIRTAWRDGWTGKGINILIADSITDQQINASRSSQHGYITAAAASETAPRASYYGVEVQIGGQNLVDRTRGLFDQYGTQVSTSTKIDVINMSFSSQSPVRGSLADPQARDFYLDFGVFNDVLQGDFLVNTDDAVIVKAAGNGGIIVSAGNIVENLYLTTDPTIKARVLIVGGLDKFAQTGGAAARLANYSNRAGNEVEVQRRFLVEYGGSPFAENAHLCDRDDSNCNPTSFANSGSQGTSYAAPRVAGYAALVRQKFDNLSGAQTAKILLDTATYEGLDRSQGVGVYGQGRVSITDALSPIGKLR